MLTAPNASRVTRFKNAIRDYSLACLNALRNYVKSITRTKAYAYLLSALFTLGIISTYPINGIAIFMISITAPLAVELVFRLAHWSFTSALTAYRNRMIGSNNATVTPEPRSTVDVIVEALRLDDSSRALELLTNENISAMSSTNLRLICEETIMQNLPVVFERLLEHVKVQSHLHDNQNALLLLAVQERRLSMVVAILRNAQVKENAHCQNNAALREACSNGSLTIVEALLSCQGVVNNITFNNNEAARLAQNNGHIAILTRLLQVNAVANFVAQPNAIFTFTPRVHRLRAEDFLAALLHHLLFPGLTPNDHFAAWLPPRANASLRQMAQSRESAMASLTAAEVRELGDIQRRYQQTFDSKGIDTIMAEMRIFLEENYNNNPVVYQNQPLPLQYNPTLPTANADVIQMYRHNKAHTAYRYLFMHPNPWVDKTALHLALHTDGERSADIRPEHKIKIAYLWLAACDQTRCPDGYTSLQLKSFFAETILAGMGRCHNYDNAALNTIAGKEVDDGGADKPTCGLGVNKWIAQFLTIISTDPNTRPLTPGILVNRFKTLLLAEGGLCGSVFNKLNALDKETLEKTQKALSFLIVENINNREALENEQIKLIDYLIPSQDAIDNMIAECKTFFSAKRITATQRVEYQGQQFNTYEELLRHLSNNILQDFYKEIDAKINSLRNPKKENLVGKVLQFTAPPKGSPHNESKLIERPNKSETRAPKL